MRKKVIENKISGMGGKFYKDLPEEEKVRLNEYHDLLVSLKDQADRGKPLNKSERVEFEMHLARLHYLCLGVFSKLNDAERKKQMMEAEEKMKELEKIFGKQYIGSVRRRAGFVYFEKLPPFDALSDLGN
jgi:hypothetical protein